jgi:hypothetical protein
MRHIHRGFIAPLVLGVIVVVSAGVAAVLGQPVWAAVAGSGLVIVYWGLEALAWRRARAGSFNQAVAAAVGGAVVRMAVVLVGLILVGILARPAFPAAALSFLTGLTAYLGVRLFAFGDGPAHPGGAPAP